jgi:uncharacterized membrane protein
MVIFFVIAACYAIALYAWMLRVRKSFLDKGFTFYVEGTIIFIFVLSMTQVFNPTNGTFGSVWVIVVVAVVFAVLATWLLAVLQRHGVQRLSQIQDRNITDS